MAGDEQYDAAVANCVATATHYGHVLGTLYLLPVDERLHAVMCEECGAIAWVTRSGNEKRWRVGGTALKDCCTGEWEESIHQVDA